MNVGSNASSCVSHITKIRFVMFVEWSRHAHDDNIHWRNLAVFNGGLEPVLPCFLNCVPWNPHDIRAALVENLHLARIDVEAGDLEMFIAEQKCKRQPQRSPCPMIPIRASRVSMRRFSSLVRAEELNVTILPSCPFELNSRANLGYEHFKTDDEVRSNGCGRSSTCAGKKETIGEQQSGNSSRGSVKRDSCLSLHQEPQQQLAKWLHFHSLPVS